MLITLLLASPSFAGLLGGDTFIIVKKSVDSNGIAFACPGQAVQDYNSISGVVTCVAVGGSGSGLDTNAQTAGYENSLGQRLVDYNFGLKSIYNVKDVNATNGYYTGKIGVGTTNPSAVLEVNGSSATGDFKVTNGSNASSVSVASLLNPNATGDTYFSVGRSLTVPNAALIGYSTTGGGNYAFITTYGRPASDFAITSGGNVGLGTTAPASKLSVVGNIASSATISASAFNSTVATGTKPLTVASTTMVNNLNADYLDGLHSSSFCQTNGTNCPAASNPFNQSLNTTNDVTFNNINFGYGWGYGASFSGSLTASNLTAWNSLTVYGAEYINEAHISKAYIYSSDPKIEAFSPITREEAQLLESDMPVEKKGMNVYFNKKTNELEYWNALTSQIYDMQGNVIDFMDSLGAVKDGYYFDYNTEQYYSKTIKTIKGVVAIKKVLVDTKIKPKNSLFETVKKNIITDVYYSCYALDTDLNSIATTCKKQVKNSVDVVQLKTGFDFNAIDGQFYQDTNIISDMNVINIKLVDVKEAVN